MIDTILEELKQAVKDGHLAPHMEVNIVSAILARESLIVQQREKMRRILVSKDNLEQKVENMKFDDSGKRKVYTIDLDGTLTGGEHFWDKRPTVNANMVEVVRDIYQSGNIIVIWTARQWEYAPETVGWLVENRIPFHGIMMGKGGADIYCDDKGVSPWDLFLRKASDENHSEQSRGDEQ